MTVSVTVAWMTAVQKFNHESSSERLVLESDDVPVPLRLMQMLSVSSMPTIINSTAGTQLDVPPFSTSHP